jgi:hypothetical protein
MVASGHERESRIFRINDQPNQPQAAKTAAKVLHDRWPKNLNNAASHDRWPKKTYPRKNGLCLFSHPIVVGSPCPG